MELSKNRRAFTAGLVATIVMTAMMYLAPMMGLPKMDIAAMLGGFLTKSSAAPMSAVWNLGMLVHIVMGTFILPFIYVSTLASKVKSKPWIKGLGFGVVLWAVAQVVVMPILGAGFFSANSPAPVMMVVGSFLGHLIYGILLGKMIGEPVVTRTKLPEMQETEEEVTH